MMEVTRRRDEQSLDRLEALGWSVVGCENRVRERFNHLQEHEEAIECLVDELFHGVACVESLRWNLVDYLTESSAMMKQ